MGIKKATSSGIYVRGLSGAICRYVICKRVPRKGALVEVVTAWDLQAQASGAFSQDIGRACGI